MSELDSLLAEIARLLAQAERDDEPAQLERTLTDGYARALSLEAERARLERRIGELTVALEAREDPGDVAELRSLRRKLAAKRRRIDQLRDELARLRLRHSVAVRATPR
jgi:hypothetical protein